MKNFSPIILLQNWKKLIAFSISFLLFFFGEIAFNIACGPEYDPYDYYTSFFHNNIQTNTYEPFAFNGMLYLNSEEEVLDEKEVNSIEWANYLKVEKRDVHRIMYGLDSAGDAAIINLSSKSLSNVPDSLRKNTFLTALIKKSGALKYYLFSKTCEPLTSSYNSWDPSVRDTTILVDKGNFALENAESTTDRFLKLRYAYQASRLFHYGGNFEMCKQTYLKLIKNSRSTSAVKGWALSLYAGAISHMGYDDEAAYLFSKVFASNPERRIMAYRNYYRKGKPSIQQVLKYAKTDDEKANIWAIHGFRNPDSDIQHLKETYQCNPNSTLVDALLIREVNKLEQNLLEKQKIAYTFVDAYNINYPYLRKNTDSLKTSNLKHLFNLQNFVFTLTKDASYKKQDFGWITLAYLSWMANKPTTALTYLRKVNTAHLSPKLLDQYRITKLLIKAAQIQREISFNENELLPTLRWLDQKRYAENKDREEHDTWGSSNKRFTHTTKNFYQQILAPRYAKMGDTAKAALAMLKGDLNTQELSKNTFSNVMSYQTSIFWHQALSSPVIQHLAYLQKKRPGHQLIDFLIDGLNELNPDDFHELLGTSYLRTHQYAKAIKCFDKLSKTYRFSAPEEWKWHDDGTREIHKNFANPFVETIKDFPKTYAKRGIHWNKKTFAIQMLTLENKLKQDPENSASYCYQMANALYQTGEFGNAWYFISYDATVFAHPEFLYNYNGDYKMSAKAKIWFGRARAASNDQNFKAKCTFMMARCEQKKMSYLWRGNPYNIKSSTLYKNRYFEEIKTKYAKTPFYQIAKNECSYFREFLSSSKREQPGKSSVIIVD